MSTLNVANITDGTDTLATGYVVNGSAKAWVNFDGTGTIAIRDSFNVASLTDNSTGNYDVNFSNNMSSVEYAPQICSNASVDNYGFNRTGGENTTARVNVNHYESAVIRDTNRIYTSAHGDLA